MGQWDNLSTAPRPPGKWASLHVVISLSYFFCEPTVQSLCPLFYGLSFSSWPRAPYLGLLIYLFSVFQMFPVGLLLTFGLCCLFIVPQHYIFIVTYKLECLLSTWCGSSIVLSTFHIWTHLIFTTGPVKWVSWLSPFYSLGKGGTKRLRSLPEVIYPKR